VSRESVEIVRNAFQAITDGDRGRALDYVDPAIVVDARSRVFNPTVYRGLEGLRQMLADMDDVWEDLRPQAREFLDAGKRVVVTGRMIGKGKGSGVQVERDFAGIWTVHHGRIVRWDICSDRAQALKSAGLAE
jgi:ketosteroid isomerase-like protein